MYKVCSNARGQNEKRIFTRGVPPEFFPASSETRVSAISSYTWRSVKKRSERFVYTADPPVVSVVVDFLFALCYTSNYYRNGGFAFEFLSYKKKKKKNTTRIYCFTYFISKKKCYVINLLLLLYRTQNSYFLHNTPSTRSRYTLKEIWREFVWYKTLRAQIRSFDLYSTIIYTCIRREQHPKYFFFSHIYIDLLNNVILFKKKKSLLQFFRFRWWLF